MRLFWGGGVLNVHYYVTHVSKGFLLTKYNTLNVMVKSRDYSLYNAWLLIVISLMT